LKQGRLKENIDNQAIEDFLKRDLKKA